MKKEHELIAVPLDKDFVDKHNDYENYVLVYSKAMEELYDGKFCNDDDATDALVKVRYSCTTVYRKCVARYGMKEGQVALGYRTKKILGIDANSKVKVSKTNWFCYLWHHNDSTVKWPFRIAFIALLLTAAQAVISIVKLFC